MNAPSLRTPNAAHRGDDPDADVVVVGGGPAGAITALLLARQGYDVIVVEREPFPRRKACGDCLSAGATGLLARIGLLDRILEASPAQLDGWRIVAPGGRSSIGRFGEATALALERATLDQCLLAAAMAEGVRLFECRVEDVLRAPGDGRVRGVRGRGQDGQPVRFGGRLVVGADGLRSIVAGRLGVVQRAPRLRKVSLTTHIHRPALPQQYGEMHVLDGACVGFAPVGRGRFNLTLVATHAAAGDLRRSGARVFFRDWLRRVPDLHERIGDPDLDHLLASGPFDRPVRTAAASGCVLVGDAAGYYDPFTGQGMYHGMAAAEMLAGTIGPSLRSGDLPRALRSYALQHRRMVRPARRLQRVVETILARPGTADLALRLLARAPHVMNQIIAVTGDLRPPRSLASPALFSRLLLSTPAEAR